MNDRSLTLLMPAFNEEQGIERAVRAGLDCGERLIASGRLDVFRLLVVDDGSTDATPELLRRLVLQHPELLVTGHERNRGLGAALRTGFASVDTDLVFYTDADLPVDLRVVDAALSKLRSSGADIVSARRRTLRGSGPRRLAYSVAYNGLCRVLYGFRVRDVNFAAKLLRTEVLRDLPLRSEGSFIDAEVIARATRRGHRVVQLAVTYHPRLDGTSTLSSPTVIATMIAEMRLLTPEIRRTVPAARAAP